MNSHFNSILFSPTLGFHVDPSQFPTTNFQKQQERFSRLELKYQGANLTGNANVSLAPVLGHHSSLVNGAPNASLAKTPSSASTTISSLSTASVSATSQNNQHLTTSRPSKKRKKSSFKKTKQVKKYIRKGIPNNHRGWVWATLAQLDQDMIDEWYARRVGMSDGEVSVATRINFTNQSITQAVKQISVHKSESLHTQRYLYLLKKQIACKNTKQIDADIDRTFPEHPFFDLLSTKETLRRILYAYQVHNPAVGYCQAMNFQTGILLLIYQDEEMAFHMLTKILDDYLPEDLYDNSMLGVQQDCFVLEQLTKKRLPRLYSHLKGKINVDFSIFGANWFLCLCLNDYPIETSLRIWDCFFSEGYKILFRVGVAVLSQMQSKLLQCQNDGEVLMSVRSYASTLYDCQTFMKQIFSLAKFPKRKIIKYRKQFRANLKSPRQK